MLVDEYRRTLAAWTWTMLVLGFVALVASLSWSAQRGDFLPLRITSYTLLVVVPLVTVLVMLHYLVLANLSGKPTRAPRR